MPEELVVVECPQLVTWLESDSVESVGVKNNGSSFYCSAFSTLALADNGSWFVDETFQKFDTASRAVEMHIDFVI